ncbi:5'-3' exoribonuclease 3-like isoform X3 [Triticum dicoccoides]|uniref:5'-3' exoribonuclease 3-like isoform X3 n=1 Tax=Triticum dicoccoides TaxID=85692 RepID=UPI0018910041|nr:5'-3' exoribonuclease 3-like isoform X3 [Triticum dicoccoides]
MGIPSFFSWLVGKYPNIVSPIIDVFPDSSEEEEDEEQEEEEEDDEEEEDEEQQQEEIIYDNLYLDMNEIIYKCFRLNNGLVYHWFFDYMDRLFRIVRPRRLLYLAVDGVAPMAKMNKLRQGYFKYAKHHTDAEAEAVLLTEIFRAQGKEVLPRGTYELEGPTVKMPGTEFMEKISILLEYFIRERLKMDPEWKDIKVGRCLMSSPRLLFLKVILSDANVPREGEHKIMSFIRAQRSMGNYDPNTRHCLHGHDADLIMLALASHEVHISILREVNPNGRIPARLYQFVNIWVLREYLEIEMKAPDCNQDIERLIDDFILICFLTGNDFIPRIPSLEINEFAVDLLIEVYKTTFNKMGGYIINTNKINDKNGAYLEVSRLEKFLHELSLCEERILLKRYELREKLLCKIQREAAEDKWAKGEDRAEKKTSSAQVYLYPVETRLEKKSNDVVRKNTRELWRTVNDICRSKDDLSKNGACKQERIRLGWKSQFYTEKFGAETSNEVGRLQTEMVQKYLEGLCWVLQCYFSEVPSWTWNYPFNYAPFASDFKYLSQFKTSFTMDKPLRAFDQLMAVLPPEKHVLSCALPKCYSKLIGCEDSIIQIFYPSEFEIDSDGKRFLSQGIAKLPFIDKELLLSATKMVEKDLTEDEMRLNDVRQERIFLRNSHSLANNAAFVPAMSDYPQEKLWMDTSEIGGWLSPDEGAQSFASRKNKVQYVSMSISDIDMTVSAMFFNPEAVKPISRLLDNVIVPDKTITEADIRKRPMWHTYPGPRPRPPHITHRPETLCRASSTATPREEHKLAGEGWLGRGRGSAPAPAAPASQTRQIGPSGYGRGSHGVDMAQSRGGRFDGGDEWAGGGGGGGTVKRPETEGRPVGLWARGGGRRGSGPARAR